MHYTVAVSHHLDNRVTPLVLPTLPPSPVTGPHLQATSHPHDRLLEHTLLSSTANCERRRCGEAEGYSGVHGPPFVCDERGSGQQAQTVLMTVACSSCGLATNRLPMQLVFQVHTNAYQVVDGISTQL